MPRTPQEHSSLPQAGWCLVHSITGLIRNAFKPAHEFCSDYGEAEQAKYSNLISLLKPHVRPGDSFVDIGCANGLLTRRIRDDLGVDILGVDLHPYPIQDFPFRIGTPHRLPLDSKASEHSLLSFTLHHTTDHSALLKEAIRVTRRRILIFEDVFCDRWERYLIAWKDIQSNLLESYLRSWKGYVKCGQRQMSLPFTFRTVEGWLDLFQELPEVTNVVTEVWRQKQIHKAFFCLELKEGTAPHAQPL